MPPLSFSFADQERTDSSHPMLVRIPTKQGARDKQNEFHEQYSLRNSPQLHSCHSFLYYTLTCDDLTLADVKRERFLTGVLRRPKWDAQVSVLAVSRTMNGDALSYAGFDPIANFQYSLGKTHDAETNARFPFYWLE